MKNLLGLLEKSIGFEKSVRIWNKKSWKLRTIGYK